jgi:Flp pilus assembly protein CpaB
VNRSNRLVILVGVLLAVLAFVLVVVLLNQGPTPGETPAEETQETVVVAIEDIAIGEAVTPDKLETREVDPEAVQQTPMRDPSQATGRPALFNIPANTQVTLEGAGLGTLGPENIAAQLQPGEKAVSLRLDAMQALNFLVQPGDSIDIVVSEEVSVLQETADSIANTDPNAPPRFEEIPGLEGARTVKTVLQDKRVLYVSALRTTQPAPADEDEPDATPAAAPVIESIVLIFAGTDQDAEVLRFVQRDHSELCNERQDIPGCASVVLRNADDDAIEDTTGITIDQLVEAYGIRIPSIVESLDTTEETP